MTEYVAIPDNVFDQPDDHFVFESVFFHLLNLFNNQYPTASEIEETKSIPDSAKIAWYLWLFATEVSSSGIPDYLLNHCPTLSFKRHRTTP